MQRGARRYGAEYRYVCGWDCRVVVKYLSFVKICVEKFGLYNNATKGRSRSEIVVDSNWIMNSIVCGERVFYLIISSLEYMRCTRLSPYTTATLITFCKTVTIIWASNWQINRKFMAGWKRFPCCTFDYIQKRFDVYRFAFCVQNKFERQIELYSYSMSSMLVPCILLCYWQSPLTTFWERSGKNAVKYLDK